MQAISWHNKSIFTYLKLKHLARRKKITKIQISHEPNVWPNGLSVCLRTKWLWVRDTLRSLKLQISLCFEQEDPSYSGS